LRQVGEILAPSAPVDDGLGGTGRIALIQRISGRDRWSRRRVGAAGIDDRLEGGAEGS